MTFALFMDNKEIITTNKEINLGFWASLEKPFFCQAPMADVTDAAFRQIIIKYSKPDVMWTEFVSADGLVSSKGRKSLLIDLKYSENERPIVAQLFTSKPENMYKAAQLIKELGFDGLDINMGCPDRGIEKQGAGAALIKNPKLAREIIRAAKEGVENKLPVSVKTRIGYNKLEIETWVPELLKEDIAAFIIHGRTRKEMSKVPASWDAIMRIVEIVKESGKSTLVIGNGDVINLEDAKKKAEKSGVDGVMLGRAMFGNPWLFTNRTFMNHNCLIESSPTYPPKLQCRRKLLAKVDCECITIEKKLEVMVEHTKLFKKLLGNHKNFTIMKKHFKAYITDFNGAKELRIKLMETKNANEVKKIVDTFLQRD